MTNFVRFGSVALISEAESLDTGSAAVLRFDTHRYNRQDRLWAPVIGQARLGVSQDFQNRFSVRRADSGELRIRIAGEHIV